MIGLTLERGRNKEITEQFHSIRMLGVRGEWIFCCVCVCKKLNFANKGMK